MQKIQLDDGNLWQFQYLNTRCREISAWKAPEVILEELISGTSAYLEKPPENGV